MRTVLGNISKVKVIYSRSKTKDAILHMGSKYI